MSEPDVVIVDSGGANLASLQFALERLGARSTVTSDPARVVAAKRVMLPGVGSAADAMRRLRDSGLADVLPRLEQPVLGICLGMQLLFRRSEEGPADCLDLLPHEIRRLDAAPGRPVPHMGWNQVRAVVPEPLLQGFDGPEYFYFVHSYAASVSDVAVALTDYGEPIAAIVRRRNFVGTQFHPERSGRAGARVLENFLRAD